MLENPQNTVLKSFSSLGRVYEEVINKLNHLESNILASNKRSPLQG